jgi:hypothetical protein
MQEPGAKGPEPALRELVVEATRALARLDAGRLEELALSCRALNRDPAPQKRADRRVQTAQAEKAAEEMAVFARVLEATRANLNVMRRLRELRQGRLEYSEREARPWGRSLAGSGHGDN